MLAALKIGVSFTHYPQEWLGDKEMSHAYMAFKKIASDALCMSTVGSNLLDDKEFIMKILKEVTCTAKVVIYFLLSRRLMSDVEVAELVVTDNPEAILMMDESLRTNPVIQHAFVEGVDDEAFALSESVLIGGDQIGLPIREWGSSFEKDDFHRMIDRRAFSQSLDAQLPAKRDDKQLVKI